MASLFTGMAMVSCSSDDNDDPEVPGTPTNPEEPQKKAVQTILVYAVSSNNLYSNLASDKEEMLRGMETIDTDAYNVLVYSVKPWTYTDAKHTLERIQPNKETGELEFALVKEWTYDKENADWNYIFATDPVRINEIINLTCEIAPASRYGVIFWSHGSAWTPASGIQHPTPPALMPEFYSFGQDIYEGVSDYINIDELALAIPSHLLDFIWFDCCYMSNIETIYQLRDKCDYFIGYPTEIFMEGMPYDDVLPYLCQRDPNYALAAQATFDWYNVNARAVTAFVGDMSKIEALAAATKPLYENYVLPDNRSSLIDFSRGTLGPYYDFCEFSRVVANNAGVDAEVITAFNEALANFTVYKGGIRDFRGRPFNQNEYSGISVHAVGTGKDVQEAYHATLDWHKYIFSSTL